MISWPPIPYLNKKLILAESFSGDGDYQIRLRTKATVSYTGTVRWEPPAIYKARCDIDVAYFPFDQQTCRLKYGSWSFDGLKVQCPLWHLY